MVTVISRIIHYGFKNFWRNGLLSTATVAIVTLCLIVFAGLILANAVTGQLTTLLQNKIDIAAYFRTNTPEDQVLTVKSSLEKLPEVKSVDYVSQDQALADFKATHANDPEITQSLDELNQNPLEASLRIVANNPSQYDAIANYLKAPEVSQYLDTDNPITYEQKRDAINRLASIVQSVNRTGLIVTIILALIAGLVVFNTIRLVIYSNRDEITIMRGVGASNMFVRGPYLMEGMIIGVISAVISLILILLGLLASPLFFSGGFSLGIPNFTVMGYIGSHALRLIGYQILFGVGLTVISSFIAVRRYLKN
jgi:cell division transport system permease protein